MILYRLDKHSIWTGETEEVSDKAPIPSGWTHHAPPAVPTGQMAQLRGDVWVLISEVPDSDKQRELSAVLRTKLDEIKRERNRRLRPGRVLTTQAPVDLRNDRDEGNLAHIHDVAKERVTAGNTTAIPFRAADDQTHMLTPTEVIQMTEEARSYGALVYAASWALKDTLKSIHEDETLTINEKISQIAEYDVLVGWPPTGEELQP